MIVTILHILPSHIYGSTVLFDTLIDCDLKYPEPKLLQGGGHLWCGSKVYSNVKLLHNYKLLTALFKCMHICFILYSVQYSYVYSLNECDEEEIYD